MNSIYFNGLGFASVRWIQTLRRGHHSEIQVVILRIQVVYCRKLLKNL